MLVLDGNIPRFPWEPSTTMLTYRLGGTTGASASYRGGHTILTDATTSTGDGRGRTNLRSLRRAQGALRC